MGEIMEIKEAKRQIRKEIKKRWENITPSLKRQWDERLLDNLTKLKEIRSADVVFIYVSTENEPDTREIIKLLLSNGKRVCVPKCTGKGIMRSFEIRSLDELEEGRYGILEPSGKSCEVLPSNIDTAIIPCAAADRNLNRLGHGGGYYDRFMEKGGFTKIVISYEALLTEAVPKEEHDIPSDYLVTEKEIYKRLIKSYKKT